METRERLVDAMSTSMRQRGYGSSAMKDVLDEASATAGSMYHFFPDGKEQLATAAVREIGLAAAAQLSANIESSPSVADGAVAFYEALADDMKSTGFRYGCPIGVPMTELAYVVEGVREAGAEVFTAWVSAIAEALEGEGWSAEEALLAARFAICAYEGASTLARATHDSAYISATRDVVHNVLSQPRHFVPR
ncbi:MAG: TetR/AcrR family transcriptional regulator [Acidimicrobiia bacterium]|nr:TetR/AcrR family transcriptional regulator [Acidimicrobiia bacterium]